MKLCVLLMRADDSGGTNRAVYTQMAQLKGSHDIELISVLRTRDEPFYDPPAPIRFLVDARGEQQRSLRTAAPDVAALAAQPSEIDVRADPAVTALTDLEVREALNTIAGDVIVTTTPPLLRFATRHKPSDTVVVHQEHRTTETRGPANRSLLLEAAPSADTVVVLSRHSARWLAGELGSKAPRIEVIPNAMPPGYRPRSSLDTKIVMAACRLVRQKQMHHLIDAFGSIVGAHPDWSLRIYGDGPELKRLRRQIVRGGLTDNAMVVGLAPRIEDEWAKASVGVLCSRHEGFPMVILEAMGAGVPFVSYDSPHGPAAIISHGVDGLLTPLDDVEALADALLSVVRDDAARRQMGRAALAATARFDAATIAMRWSEVYAKVRHAR